MSVEIDPLELGFHRPFTSEVSQILKIRNPNQTPIAFKVKTTAPKQYCVRPNSGRVEPGKEVEVTVLLQAMKQEPPLDAKCKDKFLVQSVAITADKEFANTGSVWQHVDDADKSAVQEKKIRVVYLAPENSGAAVTPLKNGVNGISSVDTPDTAPPAYTSNRSPSPPQEHFTPDTRRPSAKADEDSARRASTNAPASTLSTATTAIANATPSYEELKAKLADAQATIAKHAQEGGLRLRKVAKGETDNQTINNVAHSIQQQSQGVPLQVVAALCLLSFLLAYFFF